MDKQRWHLNRDKLNTLLLVCAMWLTLTVDASAGVTVVNMVPYQMSGEHHQDSEPNLAVDPSNIANMAGSAFTSGTGVCSENLAPIYVSTDAGNNWSLNCTVYTTREDLKLWDISLAFSSASSVLYAGDLPIVSLLGSLQSIQRATDFTSPLAMEQLGEIGGLKDQPYIEAINVGGKDRVYVGNKDNVEMTNNRHTSTIDQSLDANSLAPTDTEFTTININHHDSTFGEDGPPIRTAVHPDGTVYAAFFRLTVYPPPPHDLDLTGDIIVVRDDNGGVGPEPYTDLLDPAPPSGDGLPGVRVVRDIKVPFFNEPVYGQERLVTWLSIAVDPNNSNRVYLAWSEGHWNNGTGRVEQMVVHVRQSLTRGRTWSPVDMRSVDNAINPTLAVNSAGKIGFLYQQLHGYFTRHPRWITHLEVINDPANVGNRQDIVLADVPANTPRAESRPYLGDYADLIAIGETFYGVFSANNTPDEANFPRGVHYQRAADFDRQQLLDLDGSEVPVSIDPFFFKVTEPYFLDACVPAGRCVFAPHMEPGLLTLQCSVLDCRVVDFISKNCQVKYPGCEGCGPGMPCPPYYHIFLDDIQGWKVTLVDSNNRPVEHEQFKTENGLVISFRPDKQSYIDGQIGDYRLVFEMGRNGKLGQEYHVKTRIKVSAQPYTQ